MFFGDNVPPSAILPSNKFKSIFAKAMTDNKELFGTAKVRGKRLPAKGLSKYF